MSRPGTRCRVFLLKPNGLPFRRGTRAADDDFPFAGSPCPGLPPGARRKQRKLFLRLEFFFYINMLRHIIHRAPVFRREVRTAVGVKEFF